MKDAQGHGSNPRGAHAAGIERVGQRQSFNQHFETERVTKNRTNVYDAKTGEHLTQLTNKELPGWLRGASKSRDEQPAYDAAVRAARVKRVQDYLEQRRQRSASDAKQGNLFK